MPDAKAIDSSVTLYCTFTAGSHRFGVPARSVREVHASTAITPIAGAPRAVLGYANLRGNLFLVLSADLLLTNRHDRHHGESQLVVFKPEAGESFALETGAIGEMVAVAPHQISVPQADDGAMGTPDCVTGHAKLDHELITLIDPRRLLPAAFPHAP
jgi:chemotaxis signal transduction protein